MGSWLERIPGTAHPALELQQHQFVGAVDQGEGIDGAIAMAAVMEGEMEAIPAEPADLGIAANDHIKGGTEAGDPATQFRPGQ